MGLRGDRENDKPQYNNAACMSNETLEDTAEDSGVLTVPPPPTRKTMANLLSSMSVEVHFDLETIWPVPVGSDPMR